jgi:replicative DNA helicase
VNPDRHEPRVRTGGDGAALAVPTANEAERSVVGVVLLTPLGLAHVAGIVTADDFHDRTLARLLEATTDLADIGPFRPASLDGLDPYRFPSSRGVRIAAAATIADVSFMAVEAIAADAPTMTNAGHWARQVADAARRRRAMVVLANAYNALGGGAALEDVAPTLSRVVAV